LAQKPAKGGIPANENIAITNITDQTTFLPQNFAKSVT
jgi:hypothetical protein